MIAGIVTVVVLALIAYVCTALLVFGALALIEKAKYKRRGETDMGYLELWFGIGFGVLVFTVFLSLVMGGDLFAFGKWTPLIALAVVILGPISFIGLLLAADD